MLHRFEKEEEAVSMANSTHYGLASESVCSLDYDNTSSAHVSSVVETTQS